MNQAIDPVKLKGAAEHLEWVLKQYPDSDDIQSLLHSLASFIDSAKVGDVQNPMESIPGAYNFGDGRYIPYTNPSVNEAYSDFATEMRGGRTEDEKELIAHLDTMRQSMMKKSKL